jgi:SAM-dependent methyltransferase
MKEMIACPACSERQTQKIKAWRLSGKQARAYACPDCGLFFVHPQPPREALDAYYAQDGGWQSSRPERLMKPSQVRKKGAAPTLMAALDVYFQASAPTAGSRMFDFGCGTGIWLNSFQDQGWDTFGLEPSSNDAFVRHKRLEAIPSEPEFDFVLAYHVLEHLPRPFDTMKALAQAIRPGGHFLLSVPRLDTIDIHRRLDYCLHPRHHIVGFTEACLRGLLARAGLGVIATFHELDGRFSKGDPVRLRLLARKGVPPGAPADRVAALKHVVSTIEALRQDA